MSIDDSEANLYRRSQFLVEHNTTAAETTLRASLEGTNERRRILESLDNEWLKGDLTEPLQYAA